MAECWVNADKEEIVCKVRERTGIFVKKAFREGNTVCIETKIERYRWIMEEYGKIYDELGKEYIRCSDGAEINNYFERLLKQCKELSERGEQKLLDEEAKLGLDILETRILTSDIDNWVNDLINEVKEKSKCKGESKEKRERKSINDEYMNQVKMSWW